MRWKKRGRLAVVHNRGGNIFIWTLLWLVLVAGVLPVFVNVSAMIVVQQQFEDDGQNALVAAVRTFPNAPWLIRRQLTTTLREEMPGAAIAVVAFSERHGISTATVSMVMSLPFPVAGWSRWRARMTFQAN